MQEIMARIADKWCMLIVPYSRTGRCAIPNWAGVLTVSPSACSTLSLRKLERDGLIVRTVVPISPPQVEYSLSEVGISLLAHLELMVEWRCRTRIHQDSRTRYDELGGA